MERRVIQIIKEFKWNGASTRDSKEVRRNSIETARRRGIQRRIIRQLIENGATARFFK